MRLRSTVLGVAAAFAVAVLQPARPARRSA